MNTSTGHTYYNNIEYGPYSGKRVRTGSIHGNTGTRVRTLVTGLPYSSTRVPVYRYTRYTMHFAGGVWRGIAILNTCIDNTGTGTRVVHVYVLEYYTCTSNGTGTHTACLSSIWTSIILVEALMHASSKTMENQAHDTKHKTHDHSAYCNATCNMQPLGDRL